MSNFTKSYSITLNFENDTINLVMGRMKRKDALKLMPYMSEQGEDGAMKLSFKDQLVVMDVAADFLPKYIKVMSGLKDADGDDVSVEDLVSEAYFLELIGDILKELMEKSFMSKSETKKLEGQQEKSLEISQDTQALE